MPDPRDRRDDWPSEMWAPEPDEQPEPRLTHKSDMAAIRACVEARCLLVPKQATALLAERDALLAAGKALSTWLRAYRGVIAANARRNGNDDEFEQINAALDTWRALALGGEGEE